ncbi:hypothetical protein QYB59_001378 [Clostridium perfringens]|nr:hypothetical protein [Clostridium perfringens]
MVENRRSKLRKRKAKSTRIFVYGLWILIFALDMLFKVNSPLMSFLINSILLGILIYLEIYSKE